MKEEESTVVVTEGAWRHFVSTGPGQIGQLFALTHEPALDFAYSCIFFLFTFTRK